MSLQLHSSIICRLGHEIKDRMSSSDAFDQEEQTCVCAELADTFECDDAL